MSRTYGSVVAVKNLSFSVEYGEVMALLGVNGAGKTTTFKMLTNELWQNEGFIKLIGNDRGTSDFENNLSLCGYCPQISTLF